MRRQARSRTCPGILAAFPISSVSLVISEPVSVVSLGFGTLLNRELQITRDLFFSVKKERKISKVPRRWPIVLTYWIEDFFILIPFKLKI
jgi:hypothetical protein